MPVPGILEQAQRVRVAGGGATDFEHDFVVAIVIQIRKGNAVALVDFARSGRDGHVHEGPALAVTQEDAGQH